MRRGSGKQVFLEILSELSTRVVSDEGLQAATRRLRAAMLIHGSTAEESFDSASRLIWASDRNQSDGDIERQGIASKNGEVFISDVFEAMIEAPGLKDHVLKLRPEMSADDYEACTWALWLTISSVQMFSGLLSVEHDSDLDVDGWVEYMSRHYDKHFIQDDSFEGYDPDRET